jgi:glycerol-3-phosphate cytidylyltransferase
MKTVLTYGTFDLFHIGHHNILKRAKALGDRLVVGVTGEVYDLERGKLEVIDSLATRIANVKASGFVDEVFVEEYLGQKISDVQRYNADILVLGADWKGKVDYLNKYCEVVYLPRTKDISSTQLRNSHILRVGLITDSADDGGFIRELHYLTTFHEQAVYAPDRKVAAHYKKTYNVDAYSTDDDSLKTLLDSVDAVYIRRSADMKRYLTAAIDARAHIITDKIIGAAEELAEIYDRAGDANVLLIERTGMIYSRNWDQLVWMAHSGELGDIRAVNISFEADGGRIAESLVTPLTLVSGLMGYDYDDVYGDVIEPDDAQKYGFANVIMRYGASCVHIQTANTGMTNDVFEIIGERAVLRATSPWADMQHFVVTPYGDTGEIRPFSYNVAAWKLRYYFLELKKLLEKGNRVNSRYGLRDNLWLIRTLDRI